MTAKHFEQSGFTRTVVTNQTVTLQTAGKVNDSGKSVRPGTRKEILRSAKVVSE